MPPRRPGGKYKGVVKSHRGEETLLAEAAAAKQQALEEHISRLEAKKEGDAQALEELRKQKAIADEAKRSWIISSWINKDVQDERKWFRAWQMGVKVCRQEKETLERAKSWRKCCSLGIDGGRMCCAAHLRLRDAHADPLQIAKVAGRTLFNGPLCLPAPGAAARRDLEAEVGGSLPRLGSAADLRTTGASGRTAAMSLGAALLPDGSMRRNWSWTSLAADGGRSTSKTLGGSGAEPCRGGLWGCHCPRCRSTGKKLPDFVDPAKATVMIHHRTGRRCLVDPSTMRMAMADTIRPGALGTLQSVV